ncbi:long-chain fatty acid--CoA ligase [Rhodococcus triatomae]|uniref:Feruloyl-CoA synthase n=1 Tax=Rhodococcus triatomae TaxID=300028 RepID=A0A1G8QM84_9NOCA|nr:long-chain-fatty-acid--CoA ligase [Rhodococcus triatomae]QNG20629.1 long-chain fatty acid--CoA ligase [Rhodococcus triatomae]QNG23453.1 long-chain fatty acid--CoA ligase [Rhodococcus triatomae]SDJ05827.1 feruloyl-CoA synthase [Rhodococcus triatomae]
MNIVRVFDSNVRKYPDKTFLHHDGTDHTYTQVEEDSRKFATLFRESGLRKGDRVALMCYNTPGFVHAMLGAWRIGAVVVPINHKLQAPEVEYILDHADVKVLVFDGALAEVAGKLDRPELTLWSTDTAADGFGFVDELAADRARAADEPIDETDPAEILYTSGTTGSPKGCVHTHRNVVLVATTAASGLSITRDERLLMAVPVWHASPLNNWLLGTLYMGGSVVLLREYHPVEFLKAVQHHRITLCFGPPVIYTTALNLVPNFDEYDLTSVRAWLYGGGPIGPDVARRLIESYRTTSFYQVYGMTETGPVGTVLYPEEQLAKAGSIGRVALAGVDMRLVSADGSDAGPGEIGEIWLRSETVMTGYLDDPAATEAAFDPGSWYRTGDLARSDEDGYLFVVDRAKDMIVTGGENVYSKEVEDAISAHPDIVDVAVVGKPHPEWGETVVAHIVIREPGVVDGDALRSFLADRIARYKIPREYVVRTVLPRTPTGKIQKHLIRAAD